MAGAGNTQIINGQTYTMYSPEWYAAQTASTASGAAQAGKNAGSFASNALNGTFAAPGAGGSGLSGLQSTLNVGGAGTPGVGSPATGGPVQGGSSIPGIAPIDTSAATSAAFGAAKDQSGQEAQASLKALRGLASANGLSGGGMEAEGEKGIVENALGEMGSASRANATTQAANALDTAKTNQAAGITQRGQDIAASEANANLAQTAAYEHGQQQLQMLQLALGLLPKMSLGVDSSSNGVSGGIGTSGVY